jgi:hypothetical protein
MTELPGASAIHNDVPRTQHDYDLEFFKYKKDFEYFAPRCLQVKPKKGGLVPLKLNFSQQYIHKVAEDQLKRTGKVRIICVKGRQQGISTYIEGRLYWKTSHNIGKKAYILTHEAEATKNLFEMVERYHENCPTDFRPDTGKSNAKELDFDDLDTVYAVGTAGAKGTGRSQTIHYFHGSEVAYWPHAESHSSGVMEGVSGEDDTEIWLESTAQGPADYFHSVWERATDVGSDPEPNANEYIRVFIPWHWEEEYRSEVRPGFVLDEDEIEIMETYDLDNEQMQWRRIKIAGLGGDKGRFERDYPNTPQEAFSSSAHNVLISPHLVVRGRKRKDLEAYGARILGVDVAREGDDRTVLAFRHGRVVPWIKSYKKLDNMEVVGLITKAVREFAIDHIFCDGVGNGSGVIDRLRELGYGDRLTPIKGNYKPLDPILYYNKRGEMWGLMKDWLEDEPVLLPDDSNLQADLCGLTKRFDSKERMVLERKEDAKKRGIKSPDMGDGLAFTFAQPVSMSSAGSFEPED